MKKSTKNKIFINYLFIGILAFFIFLSLYILLNTKVPINEKFQLKKDGENFFLTGKNNIFLEKTKMIVNVEGKNHILWIEVGKKIDGTYKINLLGKVPNDIYLENVNVSTVIIDMQKIFEILIKSF